MKYKVNDIVVINNKAISSPILSEDIGIKARVVASFEKSKSYDVQIIHPKHSRVWLVQEEWID
jgi:hypothetical protein